MSAALRAAADQWSAARSEVDRFASRYGDLCDDPQTESVVLRVLSGQWRALAWDLGRDIPEGMDGRMVLLWAHGEIQVLPPGWRRSDLTRPSRTGPCDRCEAEAELRAAYVVPAPPTLVGLAVCARCANEMNNRYIVPWVEGK